MSSQAVNAVLELLMDRVAAALPGKGGPKSEKLVRQFNDEPNRGLIEEFIREPDMSTVYIYFDNGEKLAISLTPQMKKKGIFMLKSKNIQDVLKLEDFKSVDSESNIRRTCNPSLSDVMLISLFFLLFDSRCYF